MRNRTQEKNKWIAEKLDRINLTVPKGHKETIHTHATAHSESVNGFTNRAINEAIARDLAHDALLEEAEALAAELKKLGRDTTVQEAIRLLEAFSALESVLPKIKRNYISQIKSAIKANEVTSIGQHRELILPKID